MIAMVLAAGLQAGQVGAGVGFAVALAPTNLAARDRRQVVLFLLLIAVLQQGGAEHGYTKAVQGRACVNACCFLFENLDLCAVQSCAAVFLRPGRGCPATAGHAFQPKPLVFALESEMTTAPAQVLLGFVGKTHGRGTVILQPVPDLVLESLHSSQLAVTLGNAKGR